ACWIRATRNRPLDDQQRRGRERQAAASARRCKSRHTSRDRMSAALPAETGAARASSGPALALLVDQGDSLAGAVGGASAPLTSSVQPEMLDLVRTEGFHDRRRTGCV